MITRLAGCSSEAVETVAGFVYKDNGFLAAEFPHCSSPPEVSAVLRAGAETWYVLISTRPVALFKLDVFKSVANISKFCHNVDESIDATLTLLRDDIRKMKVIDLNATVWQKYAETFAANGYENRGVLIRLSRTPIEVKMMPILPLTNPTKNELQILANLMYESYRKIEPEVTIESKEGILRRIMLEPRGTYLSDASFASGAPPNLVSACLVTLSSSTEASVAELFTHPLYRARGLATTEIAAAMSKLIEHKIETMTALVQEQNQVAKRLFSKIGFQEAGRLAEMTARIR